MSYPSFEETNSPGYDDAFRPEPKAQKEIISVSEMHGFMFNERTLHFDGKALNVFLNQELNDNSKRELIQVAYLGAFVETCKLVPKTSYGDCNVKFAFNKSDVQNHSVFDKLKNQVSASEVENSVSTMESAMNLTDDEKLQTRAVIMSKFEKDLGLSQKPKIR